MGFWSKLGKALSLSPPKLTAIPVVRERPLFEQFQRIGGGVTPATVSRYLQEADNGRPGRLVNLFCESREKDGHLQSVCGTRDEAVALTDLEFVLPEDASPDEVEAGALCRRIRDDYEDFSQLVAHLTGSYTYGHATATVDWSKTRDGFLLPFRSDLLHARHFIFDRDDGGLRYSESARDTVGIDLLAENPGRVIQLQRRIVGDVPVREGLIRVLVWAALFRNWTLRDWLALGEIGWKPWRIAEYAQGTDDDDVDALVDALERIGSQGVAAVPEGANIKVEWPKGNQQQTSHAEFFGTLGRELSKAVLGVTTSTEPGANGDRAGVEARDRIRTDLREADARVVAAALRRFVFAPAVAVNIGPEVRVPAPWFQTEESADQVEFATAVEKLTTAGLAIPAKWVRDEIGMPEPLEGEELVGSGSQVQVPGGGDDDEEDDDDDPDDDDGDEEDKAAPPAGSNDDAGEYAERTEASIRSIAARELSPTIAAVLSAIEGANGFAEARQALLAKYGELAPPRQLAELLEGALTLQQAAGHLGVLEEADIVDSDDLVPEA